MRWPLGLALLVMTACTAAPTVERDLATSTRDARIALELAAAKGPVAGRVEGLADEAAGRDIEALVLVIMADSVPALTVAFTADPVLASAPSPRLVVRHGAPSGAAACVSSHLTPGDATLVTAAFCEGEVAIGAVSARAPSFEAADRQRLYRRLSRRLFPDLYAERYGIGSGPFRFNLGGTFGF